MDKLRFIFLETLLTLGLIFIGLVTAKAIAGLAPRSPAGAPGGRLSWIRGVLYTITFALAILGARGLATGLAAGIHAWASEDALKNSQVDRAYSNALRAVELRPDKLIYWNDLSAAEFRNGQFAAVLMDEPAIRALNGGELDEETAMRLAYCHYFEGDYDQALSITSDLIHKDRYFAAPYILQGMSLTAQKKYAQAEQEYLAVLQAYPSQESAVEGLAHVHYLNGHPENSLNVLNEAAKFPFSTQSRRRFEALKAFYAQ